MIIGTGIQGVMSMVQEYNVADFIELMPTDGKIRIEVKGQVFNTGYKAKNYVNKARTIGYCAMDVEGKVDYLFLSKTPGGIVLTMPAENPGPIGLPIEGYKTVMGTNTSDTVGQVFMRHMMALGIEAPIADNSWLQKEVPELPHRVSAVMTTIFKAALSMMDDIAQATDQEMDQALDQVMGQGAGEKAMASAKTGTSPKSKKSPPKEKDVKKRDAKKGTKKARR
jgi:hypothetical protein